MGDPVETQAPVDPAPVVTIDGDLFKDPATLTAAQAKLRTSLASMPADHHLGIIVAADEHGVASGSIVARVGDHFGLVAGGTYLLKEKRPAGYVALEFSI